MTRTLLKGLALLLLFFLAVTIRMSGHEEILDPPSTHLVDPDSHLHAWRMIRAAESFPALPPWRESKVAHPDGVLLGWPPLLDYIGGGLAKLSGAAKAPGEAVARLGTLMVVTLGALSVLLAFALARRFVGFGWSLFGGVLLALWPLHVEYSRVGRVDYHVLEPLITGLAILFALRATGAKAEKRRWWLSAAGAGIWLGLAIWSWTTALFPIAAVGLALLLAALLERRRPRPPILPVAAAVALVVAAPLCLAEPYREASFALHAPSMLHLLLLGALGLAGLVVHLFKERLVNHGWLLWLSAAAVLLLPVLLIPAEAARLALSFGSRGGLWGAILEQRPLYALSASSIFLLLTYLVLVLPLLGLLALRGPRPAAQRRALGLLGLLCGGFWLLGLWQLRFIPLGLMFGAPLAAVGLAELARRLEERFRGQISAPLHRCLSPTTALAALVLLWPAADYLTDALYLPAGRHLALEQAGRWLRQHSDDKTAVMTPLSGGNTVVHLGRVSVVGSALVDPSTAKATRLALRFYTTAKASQARSILNRHGITHVLSTYQPAPRLIRFLRHLGRPSDTETVKRLHRFCIGSRLHMDSGSGRWIGGRFLEAIPWVAHRWEQVGKPRSNNVQRVQLFEVVPGAKLTGIVSPGEGVEVVVRLLTNGGRTMVYHAMQTADEHGRFTLTVPYWTSPQLPPAVARHLEQVKKEHKPKRLKLDQTITVGPALIRKQRAELNVQIPQEAVSRGGTLRIVFPPATPGLGDNVP